MELKDILNDKLKNQKYIYNLDINLQQAVRENLKTINFYKAESGLAIVMDIENGQILSSVKFT